MRFQDFTPDYTHIENCARNIEARRLPLYEHAISTDHMETVLNKQFSGLLGGTHSDQVEYFRNYCEFYRRMGYDTVSIEFSSGDVYPGSGALGRHVDPVIKTREDFDRYPFKEICGRFFERYSGMLSALREAMPTGMKAIGGVGNGIFETAQDLCGYIGLCFISADDPELYEELFAAIGEVSLSIWKRFLKEYGDIYCVLRFGDDLGYKSGTMLAPEHIKKYIIPQYARVIAEVHRTGKPFLLHSCGSIFDVMDDLIDTAKIDAKHSNEDVIAPFDRWVTDYGSRIGNFGGIDTDAVCRLDRAALKEYILEVISKCKGHGGFAFGSGNSIPTYVPLENYINMLEIVREYRGE